MFLGGTVASGRTAASGSPVWPNPSLRWVSLSQAALIGLVDEHRVEQRLEDRESKTEGEGKEP